MNDFIPTYENYKKILNALLKTNKLFDYKEAKELDEFIVLRHDIEFSVIKAFNLAKIENSFGVSSSYFVQIGNDAYNPFSDVNKTLLKEMYLMGHKIGLHYRQNSEVDILSQCKMLENYIGIPIDRFSTHRPDFHSDYDLYNVNSIINAYGKNFFEKTSNINAVKIKYISDSGYKWNYGFPCEELFLKNKKIQILIHPFQWAEENKSISECFQSLLGDISKNNIENFKKEFKNYEG